MPAPFNDITATYTSVHAWMYETVTWIAGRSIDLDTHVTSRAESISSTKMSVALRGCRL